LMVRGEKPKFEKCISCENTKKGIHIVATITDSFV
jgi:hypothetical protein